MKTLRVLKREPLRLNNESIESYTSRIERYYNDVMLNFREVHPDTLYVHWENTGWLRTDFYYGGGSSTRVATLKEINELE